MATVAEVDGVAGAARYIDDCLNAQSYHMHKYIMSGGWVFPGWIGFSNWVRKESSHYPKREVMVELGRISRAQRGECTWFWLYLWEKGKRDERQRGWIVI